MVKRTRIIMVGCLLIGVILVLAIANTGAATYNYGDAMEKAIAWFDANRCGTNVATNNVFSSWRGACHTSDAINGGFHDAGDHVKFQLPAAFAASCIGWSIYEFKGQWSSTALTKAQQELQIFCDYALAGWNGSTLVVQIGDGGADHGYWGPPEDQTGSRPSYRNAAADILGQTAASLALMYINFGGASYLNAAKAMFNVAKANPASQSTVADGYYTSTSSYDDLAWASIWLSIATGDSSYLANTDAWMDVKNDPGDPPYQKPWTYCWDDSQLACTTMMYKLTGNVKYYNGLIWNFDYFTKTLRKTTYGLPWLDSWACLRYASAEAGLIYIMYKNFGLSAYNSTANLMMDYCMGANSKSLCYLTNYTSNSVKHPHHRANEPNRDGVTHGMLGALAGGPDQSDNFTDDVNQYTFTEVALDYNASFLLGCAGRKFVADGITPGTPIPTPSPAPTSPPGTGAGLLGTYYQGTSLTGTALLTKVDPTINFNWGSNAPGSGVPADQFSVRWTGQIEARSTETYTFYLNSDDGSRLYINNTLVVNNWSDHQAAEVSGSIALTRGTKYSITVEFYDAGSDAICQLYWSTPTVFTKQIVPQTQLYNSYVQPTVAPTSAPGTGDGLSGNYYQGTALSGTALLTRVDPTVNFTWGTGSFMTGGPSDSFSARWTGQVQARSSETYTFYLNHDDGARMWVNNVQIINNWTDHAAVEDTGTIDLTMGNKYTITVEFYENSGDATCQLSWSTFTIAKEIIPKSQLYSSATPATPTQPPVTPTPTRTPTQPPVTPTPTRTPTQPPVTPTPTRTPTQPPVTPTPTGTPTAPPSGNIKVQFYNQNTAATSNQLYLNFRLVNTGTSAVTLSNVKMRYYYTADGTQAQNFYCDYAQVGSGNITGAFSRMSTTTTGADTYVEIGFSSGAGSLATGAGTPVQCRVAKTDWSNYTQTGDYSFNSTGTGYADWTKVTGYVAGALQWGTEP